MNRGIQTTLFEEIKNGNGYSDILSGLGISEIEGSPDTFGKKLYKWASDSIKKQINTLCLFSGAGGLDIGFHDAGFNIVECVELESKFVKTLELNKTKGKYLSNTNIICQDIREYNPSFDNQIDFIIGGPPCQSFSKAGIRAAGAKGTKDSRGTLFEEYVRVLVILQPKGFLFENVSGILSSEKGDDIRKIVKAFQDVGYKLSYRLLDAADYGVPQNRERLILVGLKDSYFKFPSPTHGIDSKDQNKYYSAGDALKNLKQDKVNYEGLNGRFGHLLKDIPPGLNYSFFTDRMGHPEPIFAWRSKFSDFLYKADPNLPIRTLKASGGQYTGPFHWDSRPFTVNELKRLQTFPDDYEIYGGKGVASKQIGNSVPPQFARILALSVLDQVFDIKLPFDLNYLNKNQSLSFRKIKSKRTNDYKEKAREAIDQLKKTKKSKVEPKRYLGRLEGLRVVKDVNTPEFEVNLKIKNSEWQFELTQNDSNEKYRIEISHLNLPFIFNGISKVTLISHDWSLKTLLILWKSFEKEVIDNSIRADLVQLNGYYQYNPIFKLEFIRKENHSNDKVWMFIETLFDDLDCNKVRSLSELSIVYDMNEHEILDSLKKLKSIGFEIRNHNTNSEIPENNYLIPYKFPSMNNLSLQLKTDL